MLSISSLRFHICVCAWGCCFCIFVWRVKRSLLPGVLSWRKLRATSGTFQVGLCISGQHACPFLKVLHRCAFCEAPHRVSHYHDFCRMFFNLSLCHVVAEALGRVGWCVFMFGQLFNLSFGPGASSERGWRLLYSGFRGDFLFFIPFLELVELREWGAFRFGNPTSGGTVFLHVQELFPRFPLLMNFVSHCVSLANTYWRGQKHGPRVKTEHCRPTRTELTETEMNSLVKHLIKKGFMFLECNLKAPPEVKVSGVTCWYELCGKLC